MGLGENVRERGNVNISHLKRESLTESIESASNTREELDSSEPVVGESLGYGRMDEFENYLRTSPQSHRLWIERGLAVGRILRTLCRLRLKARIRGGAQARERTRPNPKDNTLRDHAALHG